MILAGWASNNKWSVYGAMREACQMVSYEIPLGISIIVGVMAAGTLNMVAPRPPPGRRDPHLADLPQPVRVPRVLRLLRRQPRVEQARPVRPARDRESELVAGFHTEYCGLRFSFFFFAEYAAMFVVGGIQAALFLGGWNDPFGILGYFYIAVTRTPDSDNVARADRS